MHAFDRKTGGGYLMKLIVAVDEKWGIGKKNGLLFSLKGDMRYFREKTLDKVVVMGYNTLLSFDWLFYIYLI